MIPVIISGGSGSRLWPVSRTSDPKPFIKLADGNSLLQNTFLRNFELSQPIKSVLTVTNQKVFFRMADEYQQVISKSVPCDFILEPFPRNTAAAVAAAVLFSKQHYGEDEILLILPADHLIGNIAAYDAALNSACEMARAGYLVTFGINPSYAETGYGYIEADHSLVIGSGFQVKRFVEKPNLDLAQQYVDSGRYQWNSGMFCGTVKTFLHELTLHTPDVIRSLSICLNASVESHVKTGNVVYLDPKTFIHAEDISIDCALFENTQKSAVIPCSIDWSDIGSWLSIADTIPKDNQNNSIIGESILHKVSNSLFYSTDRLIAGVDIDSLIVVDTPDAVLVANKASSQDVKKIFERLKKQNHDTALMHQTVHHPWGTSTLLEDGDFYKIMRIEIKPSHALSYQLHKHRSEHWVVVDGEATVIHNDETFVLTSNQSKYIPAGEKHRLLNKSEVNLVIIEVQCGAYLGDDDVVRLSDNYGRLDKTIKEY